LKQVAVPQASRPASPAPAAPVTRQSSTRRLSRPTSPVPTAPSGKQQNRQPSNQALGAKQLVASKSAGSLGRNPASPPKVKPRQPLQTALVKTSETGAPRDLQSVQDWRSQLEETKKQIREIRAIEGQVRWNMEREEQHETVLKEKSEDLEIMERRAKESCEMSQYLAEKQHEINVVELQDAREFQEFKRDRRVVLKETDQKYIEEQYIHNRENARWNAELAKAVNGQTKEIISQRLDERTDVKEIEKQQQVQAKVAQEETRALEINLEMQNMFRQLQLEKDALLDSLQYVRHRHVKASVAKRAVRGGKAVRI